jgi:hypothetical protein
MYFLLRHTIFLFIRIRAHFYWKKTSEVNRMIYIAKTISRSNSIYCTKMVLFAGKRV